MKRRTKHRNLARDAFISVGARASIQSVRQAFLAALEAHDAEDMALQSLDNWDRYVAGLLREVDESTLPWAVSVGHGIYVQRALLELPERIDVTRRYFKQGDASYARGTKLAQETCAMFDLDLAEHLADVRDVG